MMNFFAKKNQSLPIKKLDIEPIKLYSSLSKKKEFSYLRGIQEEVLKEWHSRRDEKELVIKMNTGAGKTLTGLLILYSKMIENNRPVVYLCPDNQLFNQVIDQSENYNIPTCTITDGEFPEEFENCEAVLVTTVQRMFNGKNIFDRDKINLEAILIDDAHKCMERINDSFTLKINQSHELYSKLKKLFAERLKEHSIGTYEAMTTGNPSYIMKVPFWAWLDNEKELIKLFAQYHSDEDTLLFKWDLIKDNLSQYEMYINSNYIEISPLVSYTKNVVTYDTSNHYYALSATFTNDNSLIRDLNFSKDAVINPITPKNRMDFGQRLILTPKRYFRNLTREQHIEIIKTHLNSGENVVVLVPSKKHAKKWNDLGATVANNKNLEKVIEKIKISKGELYVFVNRYDGIDLGGDSCNVLVLEDYPRFRFLKDEYYLNIHHETNASRTAQILEQGMGRSVRSSSDYSVIYLFGDYTNKFIRKKRNHEFFNTHTRKQLEMGMSLFDDQVINDTNAVSTITEVANYCLQQDKDWKSFYTNFMTASKDPTFDSRDQILKISSIEREAVHHFIKEEYEKAIDCINEIISLEVNDSQKAVYYQMQAHFAYKLNKNKSNDLLLKARSLNTNMFQPFLGKTKFKKQISTPQNRQALNHIQSYTTDNDFLSHIDEVISRLYYEQNKSDEFEETLKDLGELLGFDSSRPEKEMNEGCDVLWQSENFAFILEAKSEKRRENKISKSDIQQLYHSIEWFKKKYNFRGEIFGVSFQPNEKKYKDAVIADNIRVVSESTLQKLRESLSTLKATVRNSGITNLVEEDINIEYGKNNLSEIQLVQAFFKKIK